MPSLCPTAPQYREHIDSESYDDEAKSSNANQESQNDNDEDNNNKHPQSLTTESILSKLCNFSFADLLSFDCSIENNASHEASTNKMQQRKTAPLK